MCVRGFIIKIGSHDYGDCGVPKINSQDSHRPQGKFQFESKGLRTSNYSGVSSTLNASRLETQEELMFQFEFEGRKGSMSQPKLWSRRSSLLFSLFVLFRLSTDGMRPTHIRVGNVLPSV